MVEPMIYQVNRKTPPKILVADNYKGFDYYILDYGVYPCAYVEVSNTKFNGIDYDNIGLHCYGGLTYSKSRLQGVKKTGWYIGWDYAVQEISFGHKVTFPKLLPTDGKRWTTEEIIAECRSVVDEVVRECQNE